MLDVITLDHSDLTALLDVAQRFIAESGWGWSYDEAASRAQFERYIESDSADVLGVFDGDDLAGVALVVAAQDFVAEPVCFVAKFYILPWARGTRAGRALADGIVTWARTEGVQAVFATATAAIGADKQFENLLAKQGFRPAGATMVLTMEDGRG